MSLGHRLAKLSDRFYDRMRHRDAFTAARSGAATHGLGAMRGEKYCLLVTYRRSGEPVPTPVWFGLEGERALFVRTESDSGKVKRIRSNLRVLVGPANARGRPAGPLAEGAARVFPTEENGRAETAPQANYGVGRRLYEGMSGPLGIETVYLEVSTA
jgi:PPOX class probable F420-dependent enzyme